MTRRRTGQKAQLQRRLERILREKCENPDVAVETFSRMRDVEYNGVNEQICYDLYAGPNPNANDVGVLSRSFKTVNDLLVYRRHLHKEDPPKGSDSTESLEVKIILARDLPSGTIVPEIRQASG